MSNPVALITAITALVTALGTVLGIILHIRNHDVKSTSSPQLPPPANEILAAGTPPETNPVSKSSWLRRKNRQNPNRPYSGS